MASSKFVNFRAVFRAVPFPAVVINAGFSVVACNAAYGATTHVQPDDLLGRSISDVIGQGANWEAMKKSIAEVLRSGIAQDLPFDIQGKSPTQPGQPNSKSSVLIPLFDPDGEARSVLLCPAGANVALKRVQAAGHGPYSKSEAERLLELFKQAPGFMCILRGPHHVFELANDAYYQLVGHREIIGYEVAEVLPEVVAQGFLSILDKVHSSGEAFVGRALPIQLQRIANGQLEQRFVDLTYQPMFEDDHKVTGIIAQGYDVTEAHLLAEEVSYQAAHDALTGLNNRREFSDRVEAITGSGPHALLYMDIDHFKIINDRCGHAAGDALLILVANTLSRIGAPHENILARLGGDEFVLLRQNCSLEEAVELAERIRLEVKDVQFVWQGKSYGITLSIGVVGLTQTKGIHFQAALGMADAACFLAKDLGRNRIQVSSELDEEVTRQQRDMDGVGRLKAALLEDRIALYGQKIFLLDPKKVPLESFYEVLVRLVERDGTVIPPSQFIPAAERFGLIEDLDRHIISKTLAHIQSRERPATSKYFVNISGITLSSPGFPEFIDRMLGAYPSVHPSTICFEVTETAAISSIGRTAVRMRALTEKGFNFALDDFGSGMATFSYLSQLPVQFIKIDGDFVKGIFTQPVSSIVVEAVVKVARTMKAKTIAESVEFLELVPHLEALGINYGQGFALHRPEPL